MNTALVLLLAALGTIALSGLPSLASTTTSTKLDRVSTGLSVVGGLVGLASLVAAEGFSQYVRVDALSKLFLIPVLLISTLGAVYGLGYWTPEEHPRGGGRLRLCWGSLAAAMGVVLLASHALVFLVAWEIMALSAFFLVTVEDEQAEVRRAGWVYLVATHVGTLCLIAFFGLLVQSTGSYACSREAFETLDPGLRNALFLLALVGFGLKAGFMPLHVWLPGAHASAPSHVSALMSGVMIKIGVYGILRSTSWLGAAQTWWGGTLLVLGALSGVGGIVYALAQSDLKRVLAYSSIENVGIILLGVGLALVGRSLERPEWVVLGLGGALLHVLNHSLFKPLLFFSAGAVIHATRTREIDGMGGLAKRAPRLFALTLVGALAISALPPLNGFASEFAIYLGLAHTLESGWPWGALAVPALALIGALAVGCFVRLVGCVFLGQARTPHGAHAHDPGAWELVPMAALGAGCIALGLAPWGAFALVDAAVADWSGSVTTSLTEHFPGARLTLLILAMLSLLGLIMALFARTRRALVSRGAVPVATWDCGFARPAARMQYTAGSFSQLLVGWFGWLLWTRVERPDPRGLFPGPTRRQSESPDLVLDRALAPGFAGLGHLLHRIRIAQQGRVQMYLLYVLLAILVLLFLS